MNVSTIIIGVIIVAAVIAIGLFIRNKMKD